MFGKTYLGVPYATSSSSKRNKKLDYFDIKIDSPYEDVIVIQGSPLESSNVPLSGKVIFSVTESIIVRRVSLKLVGLFKLDFLQMGKNKNNNGIASIVKEKKKIFECTWDNLLVSPLGEIVIDNDNNDTVDSKMQVRSKRSLSSPVMNRLMRRKTYSSHIVELSDDGFMGTPFSMFKDKDEQDGISYYYQLKKGHYELPFNILLPSELPETVEGLQSGSILYSLEAHVDRRKKSSISNIINSTTTTTSTSGVGNPATGVRNFASSHMNENNNVIINRIFWKYKYLRIIRTLSSDNFSLQEEMKVGNSWKNKLQYEISIPSRAIAIGDMTPIDIKIYPFQKGYILEKIGVSLIQSYSMKDSNNEIYEDEVIIFKQGMTEFGNLVEEHTNKLIDKMELSSGIMIPRNLKRVTPDCEIRGDLIRVLHKLTIRIHLRREDKTLEIKANLPVLLYISPQVAIEGRLVLFDQQTGKIHFRPNEVVPLFAHNGANGQTTSGLPQQFRHEQLTLPPPNYEEHIRDRLVHVQHVQQQQQDARSVRSLPSYRSHDG
ncbi:hypothetical protein NCAS_0A02320 [Naumovozyma castellii]|uniref:Arrestin C-terminal-like domain-containing protein n=1 Tax=Naumovozyma castellii TaxID=27288 RepID=G0V5Q2_NAUCA|nr:hypothetical protein NCAS_0A02320 [Naumovozyma castellii CBS 4309]CCC66790.1 hypothetical protein NCAS_0A02320 [Naumovozyma castellii CBS 4309]